MFQVGDIVRWAYPDTDDLQSYGIVQKKIETFYYTIFWFDDDTTNDYSEIEIRLVQRA